ncbi:MAG: hypothetical protein HY898_01005 [Deltaproteobacteria bacterium]|nr:hypothetical protein [Deltaproteobacteria bacterium]
MNTSIRLPVILKAGWMLLAVSAGLIACSSSSDSAPPPTTEDSGLQQDAATEAEPDGPVAEAAEDTKPVGDGRTGAPCEKNADCQGTKPMCLLTSKGHTFQGGYCMSSCDPANNDANGYNAECPGPTGVCDLDAKLCMAGCTDKGGSLPCRAGYLCAFGATSNQCFPEDYSQCDVTERGSCGAGKTCKLFGLDPLGLCVTACDVFKQDCAQTPEPQACYSTGLGEGACSILPGKGADGVACIYANDCAPGLGCNEEGSSRYCRPYCGGPDNKPCTNGKTCVDLSTDTPVSILGFCAG